MPAARSVATFEREPIVPTTSPSAHLKAHAERLPWMSFQDKAATTMSTLDRGYTLASRRAAIARAADYR